MKKRIEKMMIRFCIVGFLAFCCIVACHGLPDFSSKGSSDFSSELRQAHAQDKTDQNELRLLHRPVAVSYPGDSCLSLPDTAVSRGDVKGAVWLPQLNVMVTKLVSLCLMSSDQVGYLATSDWAAMVPPCAHRSGSIAYIGRPHAPKEISFSLSNDCILPQAIHGHLEGEVRGHLGLGKMGKQIAVNPLSVEFWRMPELGKAGLGSDLVFKSPRSINKVRRLIKRGQKIRVDFFGHENGWGASDVMYKVKAQLVPLDLQSYKIEVSEMTILKSDDRAALRNVCLKRFPMGRCDQVF